MKKTVKLFVIIALAAVIGFSMIACRDKGGDDYVEGSGIFAGKDVLGNSYSLSVGSDSRAASKGDSFKMDVKARDGKSRVVTGKVVDVNDDGTLTLEDSNSVEFTANVDGTGLDSIVGDPRTPLTLDTVVNGASTFTPRTFDRIYLRANRWDDPVNGNGGEQWASGDVILVSDFPANVSRLAQESDRYTMTISGTVDKKLGHVKLEIHGMKANGDWQWLASTNDVTAPEIPAGNFNKTLDLTDLNDFSKVSANFMDYKEIIMQVTHVVNSHIDWKDVVTGGSIPADIEQGTIMATISNFNIKLADKNKLALAGNMGDYYYGCLEDGLSVAYHQAVWHLSAENVAKVKQQGARFEFFMQGVDDILNPGTALAFIWQDPVRGLWWQDQIDFVTWNESWKLSDKASWDSYRKKISIDLGKVVTSSQIASATELNFIVASWYHDGRDWEGKDNGTVSSKGPVNIDELDIAGGNIYVSPPAIQGNLSNFTYGYEGGFTIDDGMMVSYKQASWHLSSDLLSKAKGTGAKLVFVFNKDIENLNGDQCASLALVWQNIAFGSERWWPEDADEYEPPTPQIFGYYQTGPGENDYTELNKTGVDYNSGTKTLTVQLDEALENYSDFKDATDANIVLDVWWPQDVDIAKILVSANIVTE